MALGSATILAFTDECHLGSLAMMTYDPKAVIKIRYTNYRGETAVRLIVPIRIRFAASEWHPGEQWLMDVYDIDRQAERSFALADVREWNAAESGAGTISRAF